MLGSGSFGVCSPSDIFLFRMVKMDYGPFGFVEEYHPLFAKWTGSGDHFGFMNQPSAGFANYNILVDSVMPVIVGAADDDSSRNDQAKVVAQSFLDRAAEVFQAKLNEVFRIKLGFEKDHDVGDDIWSALEPLLRNSRVDWTIFFRQLTYIVRDFSDPSSSEYAEMFALIEGSDEDRAGSSAFYEPLTADVRLQWISWIQQWREALESSGAVTMAFERMRTANPKFILREWMLAEAYNDAANGKNAELFYLHNLIQHPYEEGTEAEVKQYYRRAADEALTKGGVGFMSCSS
jgi:serine/tyrosine/threonine adenylyltransferase